MNPIYLIVGVPASGKSTLISQLATKFTHVPHDDYKEKEYPSVLANTANSSGCPVIGEIPFGLSKIQEKLESKGFRVIPVFILEEEQVLHSRWDERGLENPSTRQGHLTRQETYRARAAELGAFSGTFTEVLNHLQGVSP